MSNIRAINPGKASHLKNLESLGEQFAFHISKGGWTEDAYRVQGLIIQEQKNAISSGASHQETVNTIENAMKKNPVSRKLECFECGKAIRYLEDVCSIRYAGKRVPVCQRCFSDIRGETQARSVELKSMLARGLSANPKKRWPSVVAEMIAQAKAYPGGRYESPLWALSYGFWIRRTPAGKYAVTDARSNKLLGTFDNEDKADNFVKDRIPARVREMAKAFRFRAKPLEHYWSKNPSFYAQLKALSGRQRETIGRAFAKHPELVNLIEKGAVSLGKLLAICGNPDKYEIRRSPSGGYRIIDLRSGKVIAMMGTKKNATKVKDILVRTGVNPVRNPDLYTGFHGVAPSKLKSYQVNVPDEGQKLVKIGKLSSINYIPEAPSKRAGREFYHSVGDLGHKTIKTRTILATDEKGKNLYLIPTSKRFPYFSSRGIIG